ncbi:CDP-glycerol glycerophosphotransferase family protein [Thalassotalea atypica]|uniref:CDP-glycerol glycerophosphotransferase family protein n=1 Tax=Thalassotalea atypica TaxID=2054316 RepID=UPI0025722909|nr:CDP-glycerol glycerophosphotransferase family protein [Thalassotalea atypica]
MIIIKYFVTLAVLWPIYFIVKLIPKKKNLWCFSSYRDSFVDNSKYLFHYTHNQHKEIDAVWVTDNNQLYEELLSAGYKVVKRKSVSGILTIIRAEFVFFSSYVSEVSFWFSSGAKLVNLWHGLPLKKIEFDIDSGALAEKYAEKPSRKQLFLRFFYPAAYSRPDFVTAPSDKMAELFKSAFRIEEQNIIRSSSPRTDQFFDQVSFNQLSSNELAPTIGSKVFIYMPTFRDTGGEFFSKERFDFKELNEVMKEVDGEFWIKAHPSAGAEGIDVSEFERVKLLPNNIDMYPVLRDSYALITDYSSIYIDYLMLNKPIHFYCFDLKEYLENCRSMYFDYHDVTPGSKSHNFDELLVALQSLSDDYKVEREYVIKLFWGDDYKTSCKKIIDTLTKSEL